MIFIGPVFDRIHNVFADHGPLGSRIVSAAGTVGVGAVTLDPAEITGNNPVEAEGTGVMYMVVDHIHDHADAVIVECFHHLLHFLHPDSTVEGIGCVGTFRYVKVHRIITPVVLGIWQAFIGKAEIIDRQQMHMGNTKILDVIQTGGLFGSGFLSGFCQSQEFSLVFDPGTAVGGKIPDMKFVNHRIRNGFPGMGIPVLFPAFGIGGFQVQNHGTLSVDACGSGIGVTGFPGFSVYQHLVGIVHTIEVSNPLGGPGAAFVRIHLQPAQ